MQNLEFAPIIGWKENECPMVDVTPSQFACRSIARSFDSTDAYSIARSPKRSIG